jgi:hypothetical protein
MTHSNFKSIIGKKATYLELCEENFPEIVKTMMGKVNAILTCELAAKYIVNDHIDIYLIVADNATYFKTDGQTNCTQLFAHNSKTNECWLNCCKCGWNNKDIKETIRYDKKYISNLTEEDLNEDVADKKRDYEWLTTSL